MKQEDFDELLGSVREAGKTLRGEAKPSRELSFTPEDVQSIRKRFDPAGVGFGSAGSPSWS